MICHGEFLTPMKKQYSRNNRSTKQKSLRCFPACRHRGHVTQGFCGTSIKARVKVDFKDVSKNAEFVFVAEIRSSSEKSFSSESVISSQNILRNSRGQQTYGEKIIFFENCLQSTSLPDGTISMELEFNKLQHSYDYQWKSNRWIGLQETHVVDITFACRTEDGSLKVLSSFCSTPFSIRSSHKKMSVKAQPEMKENLELTENEDGDDENNFITTNETAASEITSNSSAGNNNFLYLPLASFSNYRYDRERFSSDALLLRSFCDDHIAARDYQEIKNFSSSVSQSESLTSSGGRSHFTHHHFRQRQQHQPTFLSNGTTNNQYNSPHKSVYTRQVCSPIQKSLFKLSPDELIILPTK